MLQLQVWLIEFDFFQVVTKERDDALSKVKTLTAEKNRLQQIGDARVKFSIFVILRKSLYSIEFT